RWDLPWEALRAEPFQEYRDARFRGDIQLGYTVPSGASREDATIVESIGQAIDHENENLLPTADFGLAMIRQLYLDAVEMVARGEDPPGTFRELPADEVVKPRTGERVVDSQEYAGLLEQKN